MIFGSPAGCSRLDGPSNLHPSGREGKDGGERGAVGALNGDNASGVW